MEQRLFEHPLALVAKVGARMMLQVALEEEVMEVLGRDQHERRREGQVGSRNGYKERVVKLSCGDVAVEMPQVRGMGKPFHLRDLTALSDEDGRGGGSHPVVVLPRAVHTEGQAVGEEVAGPAGAFPPDGQPDGGEDCGRI